MTTMRVAFFLALLAYAALLPATSVAQTGARDSVVAIGNTAFTPQDVWSSQYGIVGVGATGCRNTACQFTAAAFLPPRATIVGVDLFACDASAAGNAYVRAEVFMCTLDPYACSFVAGVQSTDVGCSINSSPPVNVPTQDANVVFPVMVTISDPSNGNLVLRAVRVRYRRSDGLTAGSVAFPNDVAADHPFFRFVEALAAAGITGGCGGGAYCPDRAVTRGELAVFLATALGLAVPN